jgi:hypothetical protein
MKGSLIACASVVWALAGAGCSSGGGAIGVAPLSGSVGVDPANNGGEANSGSGATSGSESRAPVIGEAPGGGLDPPPDDSSTIDVLCARACAHIQSACPGSSGGAGCVADCAQSTGQFPGCESLYKLFVACVATAPLDCVNMSINNDVCTNELNAVIICANLLPPGT